MIKVILERVLNNTWPMLLVFIISICVVRFFYIQNHKEKFVLYKECMLIFSIIYLWLLFELLTTTELNHNSSMNLVPFSEILRYEFGSKMFILNVIGNIVIFIPFGYLISEYIKSKKIWQLLITSLITSISVEFIQLNIGRSFDVDDIFLNVLGTIIGYLIYKLFKKLQKHLPDFFKSSLFYNIIWLIIIFILVIYFLGYWEVMVNAI